MDKDIAIKRLYMSKEAASLFGISKMGLFGSTVRRENTPQSDVDILIDFHDGKETFSNFMSVCELLEKSFGDTKVDVVTLKGLSPYIGKQILSKVEYV